MRIPLRAGSRFTPVVSIFAAAALTFSIGCGSHQTTEPTSGAAPRTTAALGSSALPPNSWIVPPDVAPAIGSTPTQTDWLNFGWQTFVALNWPSATPTVLSGTTGLPNTQLTPGATSSNNAMVPTIWLTFRSAGSTMLAGAADPGPWASTNPALPSSCQSQNPPIPTSPGFQPMLLSMSSKFGKITLSSTDEASGPPLIEQSGWYITYDIRLNQAEYTYIQQNGYYNATTQINQEKQNGKLVGFPRTGQESMFNPPLPQLAQYGALEVKAAWRILDPVKDKAIIPRYYTQAGYFLQPDGMTCQGPALFGLVAFHILRLTPTTPATWYWATFEQADNVTAPPSGGSPTLAPPNTPNGNCTSAYNNPPQNPPTGNIPWNGNNTPVNVCQVTPIGSDVQQVNTKWQGNLAGTVWANYQMVNALNPAVPGNPFFSIPVSNANVNTNILANTAMETYVQGSGPGNGQSCMDCHAFATPQGAQSNSTNQIFTFVLMNADTGNPTTAAAAATGKRRVVTAKLPPKVLSILQNMKKKK